MESIWIRVGGRLVHARVADRPTRPAAPAVVCIHGLMVSGRYMVPLAERLAGDYRVYVPDLPGFGRSQPPAGRLTIAGLADAAAAWMDAMGLDRAALVANSLGCQVVAALGRRHPQRLTRAALIGPTVDAAGRSTVEQARRLLLDMLREPPSSFPLLARDALDAGLRRPLATWAAALDDRLEANVAGLAVPVLVLRGARDPIAPQRWAAAVAGYAPRGRLAVIPDAAHIVHFSHPGAVRRVLGPFLDGRADVTLPPAHPAERLRGPR